MRSALRLAAIAAFLLASAAGCAAGGTGQHREPPSAAQMASIQPGMERAEVERILGAPTGGVNTFKSGETVVAWLMAGKRPGVLRAYFNVHFRDGKVERTSESFDYAG
jgi:hypothetical protein